ncbi:MAG: hypothetical protein JNG84_03570 [Archangium sp.]|nr:hypothetical protein [Archangium sp.]
MTRPRLQAGTSVLVRWFHQRRGLLMAIEGIGKQAVKAPEALRPRRDEAPAQRPGGPAFSEKLEAMRGVEAPKPPPVALDSADAPTEKMPQVEVAPVSAAAPVVSEPRPDVVASVAEKTAPKEKPKAFTIAELNRGTVRLR